MWQSAVDLIGKLGPLSVAVAVYISNRMQTRWANTLAARAAAVEDQKFRLALIDRRTAVIDAISTTIAQCWVAGAIDKAAVTAVVDALRRAELVFDDEQCGSIRDLVSQLWIWRSMNREVEALQQDGAASEAKYRKAVEELGAFEDGLTDGFGPLVYSLKQAARVSTVPPFVPPAAGWGGR